MKLKSLLDYTKPDQICPLSQQDTEIFLMTCMMDINGKFKEDPPDAFNDSAPAQLRILQARLKWAGIAEKVSFPVKLFLCCLCDRPGTCVQWAYTLAHMLEKQSEQVTMDELTLFFPDGFPTEATMEECWDAQKGFANNLPGDNLLDQLEYWQPEKEAVPA